MQVVILCGGKGTRLQEETEYRPKPLVEIGGMPILWHIMRTYAHHGFTKFILCLGYKGWMIKDYFLNYQSRMCSFTLTWEEHHPKVDFKSEPDFEGWEITFLETGDNTMTGGRLKQVTPHIKGDQFMLTYGDGLCGMNIKELLDFHNKGGKIGTVTGVHPAGRFGDLQVKDNLVTKFAEKPQASGGRINGGYMVFQKEFLNTYLPDDPSVVLEQEPLIRLADDGQLMMYPYNGFWQPMDTFREKELLSDLWGKNKAPWKVWS